MRKKSSERLQTVLKLAKLREQAAAVKLAENIRNVEQHQHQQQQIKQYQGEYTRQFQQPAQQKTAGQLDNLLRFIGNLEQAADIQQQRSVLASEQLQQAKLQWQQLHGREKNMQTLIEKKQRQESWQEDNKVQRQLDDRTVNNINKLD